MSAMGEVSRGGRGGDKTEEGVADTGGEGFVGV